MSACNYYDINRESLTIYSKQTDTATLRRVAIMSVGRLPTDQEIAEVEFGSDDGLRSVLRNRM